MSYKIITATGVKRVGIVISADCGELRTVVAMGVQRKWCGN